MENLLQLMDTLRWRINAHGDAMRQSETLTRYALVDPLLRELGWDTADPNLVIPQYRSAGKSDYALLVCGSPVMMVEASNLDAPLQDSVAQGIDRCRMQGTAHLSVTDGRRWQIYAVRKPAAVQDMVTASFDIADAPTATVCVDAMVLWRPRLVTQTEDDWQPLSDIHHPGPGTGIMTRPVEMQFPDGACVPVRWWYMVIIESARWLLHKGILTASDCPVRGTRRSHTCVVNTVPIHPNGSMFKTPTRQVGALHVAGHHNARENIRDAKLLLRYFGQDLSQFKLRFPNAN